MAERDWEKEEAERKRLAEIKRKEDLAAAIPLWKKLKIASASLQFSCGGDSMNDTSITFADKNGNDVDGGELEGYFLDAVYHHVQFYEASDGVYEGEAGTVEIELNEEGDGFYYSKNAQAEYNENHTETTMIALPAKVIKFIKDNVHSIGGSTDESVTINFKKDLILSDADEKLVDKIKETLQSNMYNFVPTEIDETLNDWRRFSTGDDELVIKGNSLQVNINVSYTRYEDAND